MYLRGEEEEVFFKGSIDCTEARSFVISDLCKAFMRIAFERFDITSCQVTKVLALAFSVCSVFPAPWLCKSRYLVLAAVTALVGVGSRCGWQWGWGSGEACLGWLLQLQASAQTTGLDTPPRDSGQASQVCWEEKRLEGRFVKAERCVTSKYL